MFSSELIKKLEKEGICGIQPTKEGRYFVKLTDVTNEKIYDIDYIIQQGESDGGGLTWNNYYDHNVVK